MKLTIIGNGNMAKALINGLIKKHEIEVIGRNATTLEKLKAEIPDISIKVIQKNENIQDKNIILCIKPYSLSDLSSQLQGNAKAVYSVLAGTTLENLRKHIHADAFARTMPNVAATYSKSMTTITGDDSIKNDAINIFNSIGKTLWVKTQKELDIATGLAGSGPAFLALIAEGLEDGAVNAGLSRKDARELSIGLFDGFSSLLTHDKPSDIKDTVMSPGGTTAAGYAVLENSAVRSSMINTILKAYEKTLELGKK